LIVIYNLEKVEKIRITKYFVMFKSWNSLYMKFKQRYVRYLILLFSFVIFTYAIKVFVQNFNMNKEINNLKNNQSNLSWETTWMHKYYKYYVNSHYMKEAFLHKSWIPSKNEILVKIDVVKNSNLSGFKELDNSIKYNYTNNTKDKWNTFFLSLYKNIF